MNLTRRALMATVPTLGLAGSAQGQVGLFTLMPGIETRPQESTPTHPGGSVPPSELRTIDKAARPTQTGLPDTRGLWLVNPQTREEIATVFYVSGQDHNRGYTLACRMLRDWRRDRTVPLDPKLLHMLWSVQRQTEFREPIVLRFAYTTDPADPDLAGEDPEAILNHRAASACDFTCGSLDPNEVERSAHIFGMGGVGRYDGYMHIDTGRYRKWRGG